MKRVIITMTYYNRPLQLKKTLDSIRKSEYKNFEVIITDDASDEEIKINKLDYDFPITIIRIPDAIKDWTCPIIPYNVGIYTAIKKRAEIIMVQNAECIHEGDIIYHASNNVSEENYLSYACYSLDENNTFDSNLNIHKVIESSNVGAWGNGVNAWYNHSQHRAMYFDFCSAMTVGNMIKLNGYDERFADGMAFADNDFINRISNLGLTSNIIDTPFVIHQWHYNTYLSMNYTGSELYEKNKVLFEKVKGAENFKALHNRTKNFGE